MLIEDVDYFVHLVPFPSGPVDGMVTPNDDGTFTIYLNSNVSEARRKKALEHELNHIRMDHFYDDASVEVKEMEADAGARMSAKSDWFTSWGAAMLWADQTAKIHGCSDSVPEYDPTAWKDYTFRRM